MLSEFQRLYDILKELRQKCPWDKVQTKETIRHLTIEETYELSEAILDNNRNEIKAELGDLFMHMLFYCSLAEDEGAFSTEDMIRGICEKLVRRHPHIYGEVVAETEGQVLQNWEQIKMKEKEGKKDKSVLDGVPGGLPSLIKAMRIQEKVRNVGFDWEQPEQVWEKVKEEMGEFQEEAEKLKGKEGSREKLEGEFGDLLFSLVNYARFMKINPEDALEKTNLKFKNRFQFLEKAVEEEGKNLKEMNLAEMDIIWERAKLAERK